MTIQLKSKSLLRRWYLFNKPYDAYKDLDICKFRRVCFITAPLKWLIIGAGACYAIWLIIVMPFFAFGWKAIFIYAAVAVVIGSLSGLAVGVCYVTDRATASEIYRSWKEKYCVKVEFVDDNDIEHNKA